MKAKLPHGTLDALWNDPANWRRYFWYYCKDDPRLIVPKRGGALLGFTRNRAHAASSIPILVGTILVIIPMLATLYFGMSKGVFCILAGVYGTVALVTCGYLSSRRIDTKRVLRLRELHEPRYLANSNCTPPHFAWVDGCGRIG